MAPRSIAIRFSLIAFAFLTASAARAECINPGDWWLRDPLVELVFSGTVVEITRTAEVGYRATIDIDRVWKGVVPKRFDLYVWELSPEMDRIDARHRYVIGARRLTGTREREGVGLTGNDAVAFTEVACGAPAYEDAERTGIIRSLGASKPE